MLAHGSHRRCVAALVLVELATLALALRGAVSPLALASSWLVGLIGWTLVEYLLHRFVFHVPRASPWSRLGARAHLDHHDAPARLPITKPLHLTVPALIVALALASTLGQLGLAGAAGLIAGYLGYELAHVAAHVLVDDHPWPRLQAHHLAHHADDSRAFGITTGVWDRVFGTGRGRP